MTHPMADLALKVAGGHHGIAVLAAEFHSPTAACLHVPSGVTKSYFGAQGLSDRQGKILFAYYYCICNIRILHMWKKNIKF